MVDKPRVKDKQGSGKVDPGNVYNYLREKGVSHNHALGMLANLNTESQFNPLAEEKPGTGKGGVGLFQHTGPRRKALLKYVNGDLTNWKKQVDFTFTEDVTRKYLNKDFSTAESAGEHFMLEWEAPKDQSKEAIAKRMGWIKTFGGGKYADPNYVPTSSASISSADYDTTPGVSTGLAQEFLVSNPQDYHQKAAEFKKELAVEKEKAKKIETDGATKELTAAQIEHNKRIEFLNVFNTPKEASAATPTQEQSQEVGEDLYTQNLGFDLQDTSTPLFKTTLDIPQAQEFGDGGRKQSLSDLSIGNEYHYQGRPEKSYKLNDNGEWLIRDYNSKDTWKPIKDPTGERAATLERSVIPKEEYTNQRKESIQKELEVINGQNNKFYLPDTRTIRATTGKAIRPNIDLMAGDYSEDVVKEIITKAREKGVDPKTALAIALQESHFGKKDPNLGHVTIGSEDPYGYMDILKSKVGLAKSKGHEDELKQIQFYNGTGKLFPGTEKEYHGFTSGKFYGVPVTEAGLDMMQNPLYGKQIVDLRDNVIGKSKHIDSLLNVKQFGDGGPFNITGPRAEEIPVDKDAMNAMMKARMATENAFGNPAAQRMISPNPKTYDFGNGYTGTHFMSSAGRYAIPQLQDKGGKELTLFENLPPASSEDMKFRTPEEAQYFAEHYKEVAPMMQGFAEGGEYLDTEDGGPIKPFRTTNPDEFAYRKQMYADSLSLYEFGNKIAKEYPRLAGPEAYWSGTNIKVGNKAKIKTTVVPFEGMSKEQQRIQLFLQKEVNKSADRYKKLDGRNHRIEPIAYSKSIIGKPERMTRYFIGDPTYEGWNQEEISTPLYKKPTQSVQFLESVMQQQNNSSKKKDVVKPISRKNSTQLKEEGEDQPRRITVGTLPFLPTTSNQSLNPELIPARAYIKPEQYVGPRYGTLAGDESLDLPEGYTQQEREAARRRRDADEWQRKTQEYQKSQMGFREGGTQDLSALLDTDKLEEFRNRYNSKQ